MVLVAGVGDFERLTSVSGRYGDMLECRATKAGPPCYRLTQGVRHGLLYSYGIWSKDVIVKVKFGLAFAMQDPPAAWGKEIAFTSRRHVTR